MVLTARQRLFCDEYLKDQNATQAAIRAGYSEKTATAIGSENLRKPLIAEYIKSRLEQHSINCGITTEWVLSTLKANIDRAVQDGQGNTVNRGLEIAAKCLGMFETKQAEDNVTPGFTYSKDE